MTAYGEQEAEDAADDRRDEADLDAGPERVHDARCRQVGVVLEGRLTLVVLEAADHQVGDRREDEGEGEEEERDEPEP